jgi:predicted  nucleic acid-binding Zn-ribbon protein
LTLAQPLECVCRQCSHVFAVPVTAKCPECGSRYLARVTVSDTASGKRIRPLVALGILERYSRALRIAKSRRDQEAKAQREAAKETA